MLPWAVGEQSARGQNRRTAVKGGEGPSHKPFRAVSNKISNPNFYQNVQDKLTPHSSGQQNCIELSFENRRNSFSSYDSTVQRNLGASFAKTDHDYCRIPARGFEYSSGLGISHTTDSSEWKLCPMVFRKITRKLGYPQLDLFAGCLSHQIPQFFLGSQTQ